MWITRLLGNERRTIPHEAAERVRAFTMITDASDSGFGVILFPHDGSREIVIAGPWTPWQLREHISLKETLAVRLGLQLMYPDTFKVPENMTAELHLRIDNTSTIGVLRKGYSKTFALNAEAKRINNLALRLRVVFKSITYIRSESNEADSLSRIVWKRLMSGHIKFTRDRQRQASTPEAERAEKQTLYSESDSKAPYASKQILSRPKLPRSLSTRFRDEEFHPSLFVSSRTGIAVNSVSSPCPGHFCKVAREKS